MYYLSGTCVVMSYIVSLLIAIPTVFDCYQPTPHDYYHGYADSIHYNHAANNSTGTPSPHSMESGTAWPHAAHDPFYSQVAVSTLVRTYRCHCC